MSTDVVAGPRSSTVDDIHIPRPCNAVHAMQDL